MRILRLLGLMVLTAVGSSAADLQIVIYHTNDIHGWIMARPAAFSSRPNDLVGGMAALANLVKKETRPKLLLDAGDWFQGTPEGNLSRGQSLVDALNALKYDAVEVGNHEYDFGEANLKKLISGLKMPVLGANVYRDGARVDYLQPRIIKKIDGVKIGIFGLLTTNMRNLAFPENIAGLTFRDEIAEAREQVKALESEGATVIIAVTHVGFEAPGVDVFTGDQAIAREVPGLDVIVGGHSHTFLREPQHEPTHGTLIVQDGTTLSDVGEVVLDIDRKTKKVKSSRGRLQALWLDQLGEDPAVSAVLKPYEDEVKKLFDVVIATAQASLARDKGTESSLGDWIADCARDYAHSDIAVQNAGGIRADLPAGPVTLRSIYDIMPFDNYVTNVAMRGRLVQEMLDHGVNMKKGLVQVSGLSFKYDREAPEGRRVWDVSIAGRPLDPDALYQVTTLDFLVRGGDGYTPFAKAEKTDFTRTLWRDMLNDCARKEALIEMPRSGRMTPQKSPAGGGNDRGS